MRPLNATLKPHEGEVLRFAHDEPDAFRIPYSTPFDTEAPGGYGDASMVVARPPGISALDYERFMRAPGRFYAAANDTRYEGRCNDVQFGANDLTISFEGWQAALSDNETLRPFYLSRLLSDWGEPSAQRRAELLDASYSLSTVQVMSDITEPTLGLDLSFPVVSPYVALTEAWFDSGSRNRVGRILSDWRISTAGDNFDLYVGVAADQLVAVSEADADVSTGGASGVIDFTPDDPMRYAFIRFVHPTTPAGVSGQTERAWMSGLVAVGNHGIDLVANAEGLQGVLASDVVEQIAAQVPLINIDPFSIEPSTYVILDLAFDSDVAPRDVIESVTALGGGQSLVNDWGVWNDRTLRWHTPGESVRTWRARLDQFAEPDGEGPSADGRCNGAVVTFTDPAGTEYTVGPLGSGCDFEDADLTDNDPNNPCNREGSDTWKPVSAGLNDLEGATILGRLKLLDANGPKRRGSVKLVDTVTDEAGNVCDVDEVHATDRIVIEDDEDTSPRPIGNTSFDGIETVTAQIGPDPTYFDQLIGRLEASQRAANF